LISQSDVMIGGWEVLWLKQVVLKICDNQYELVGRMVRL